MLNIIDLTGFLSKDYKGTFWAHYILHPVGCKLVLFVYPDACLYVTFTNVDLVCWKFDSWVGGVSMLSQLKL